MRRPFTLLVVLSLYAGTANAAPADLVLHGGRVYTMAPGARDPATALAIAGDRIVYVGDDDGARAHTGPGTRVLDLGGQTVLPGLVDAHGHLDNLGRLLREPNLIGAATAEEAVARVREFQRRVPRGQWIHGRGWDQNDWPVKSFPTWRDLTGTEANPVYLDRVDGHAIWVNRAALDAAGITRDTPDPPGGMRAGSRPACSSTRRRRSSNRTCRRCRPRNWMRGSRRRWANARASG
jgi:hypothetical protein